MRMMLKTGNGQEERGQLIQRRKKIAGS